MKTLQGVIKPVLGIPALKSGEGSSLNLQEARREKYIQIYRQESFISTLFIHKHTHTYER
jgi:hypothetical protein